jgi:hypothetical protein
MEWCGAVVLIATAAKASRRLWSLGSFGKWSELPSPNSSAVQTGLEIHVPWSRVSARVLSLTPSHPGFHVQT